MNEVYKVRGMTCEGCANGIKENLESNDYIISANVNLDEEKVYIAVSYTHLTLPTILLV